MSAPLYMNIVTIYFAILPFALSFSIYQAITKKYKLHFLSQIVIFTITIIVVIYFEIMLRLSGGFIHYMKFVDISYTFMLIYLIVHVLIAILGIILWAYLLYSTIKDFQEKKINKNVHSKLGKLVFILISTSCFMGIGMYFLLFTT